MSEATLIFPNMRGGCATVDGKVHALFRVNGRRPGLKSLVASAEQVEAPSSEVVGQQAVASRGEQ